MSAGKLAGAGALLVLAAACATPRPPAEPPVAGSCLSAARARAVQSTGTAAERRLVLETEAGRCFDPQASADEQKLRARFAVEYAELSAAFLRADLSQLEWRTARADRAAKQAALRAEPQAQAALLAGDADGDFVADAADRCPGTPPRTATDGEGCPMARPVASAEDRREEARLRAALAASRTLVNKSCDGVPAPPAPAAIAWGRGPQTALGTQGFNIAITRVPVQKPGCDIFYEMQFQFREPNAGNPALPATRLQTILFAHTEDLLPAGPNAVFPLPVSVAALSTGRAVATEAMLREYGEARWRVRAVNGANRPSPWSPFITQGPAPGGVQG